MAIAEHIERATRLIATRDYREAVRICRRALLAHPESIQLRLLLGRGLLAMERFEEVRTEMLAVLRSSPRETRAYRFLGEAYLYDGRPDRAVETFEKALEVDPNDAEIQRLLDDAALEEPTATAKQVVHGAAEITRESVLPDFDEEYTEPTQRALPKAVFRERNQGRSTGTRSYSMPPESRPPGSLPRPGRLPTGVATSQEAQTTEAPFDARAAAARAVIRSRHSVPPPAQPPSRQGAGHKKVPPPRRKASSTVPPPAPRAVPEKPVFQKTLLGNRAPSDDAASAKANISLAPFETEPGDTKDTWNSADALLTGELDAMEKNLLDRPDTSDFEDLPTEVQQPSTSMRFRPSPEQPFFAPTDSPLSLAAEPTLAEDLDELSAADDEETKNQDPLWKAPPQQVPPPSTPPPVEQRRRVRLGTGRRANLKRWLLVGVALLVLFGIGFGLTAWWRLSSREDQLRELAKSATRHGSARDFERALGLARQQGEQLLTARLLAAQAYEYGGMKPVELRSALVGLDESTTDYVLALGYLLLLEGQPEESAQVLEDQATDAEAQYILSFAQLDLGDWDEARKSARSAAQLTPGAARYEAQRVITEAVTGVPGTPPEAASAYPALQIAALIHSYITGRGIDVERAKQLLGQEVSVANQAWLRWLLLRSAIDTKQERLAHQSGEALTSESAIRALRHAPSPLRLLIADAMLDMGASDKAGQLLSTLSSGVRVRPEALAPQVRMLLMQERASDARSLLQRVAKKSPTVALLKARVELAEDNHKAALVALEGAMQDQSTRAEAMALAAKSYRALGNWSDAIGMLEPLWKARKSDATITQELLASLLAAGQTERAVEVIEAFEKAGGGSRVTAGLRARIALEAGDLASARKSAGQLDTSAPEAAAVKAQILRRTGQLDEAQELLTKALQTSPRKQELLQEMVLVSLRRYDFAQAQKSVKLLDLTHARSKTVAAMFDITNAGGAKALEGIEDLAESKDADLHLYRAYGLYHAEKNADARRAFDHVLELRPGHPEALAGKALAALRSGGLSAADASIEAARNQSATVGKPFEARTLAIEAKLNYERGGFSNAQELVAKALELDEDCALAHLVSASLDEERGDKATSALKKASEGTFVMPEALARYALSSKKPLCDMATRYLEAAPRGFDAPDMRRITKRCN